MLLTGWPVDELDAVLLLLPGEVAGAELAGGVLLAPLTLLLLLLLVAVLLLLLPLVGDLPLVGGVLVWSKRAWQSRISPSSDLATWSTPDGCIGYTTPPPRG